MPSKRKKNDARKAKKEGRRESESKSQFCFLRMPELRKLILLHLDQKAAKSTTCERLCGKF